MINIHCQLQKRLNEVHGHRMRDSCIHRERITTEEEAKVVASVWGGRNYSIPLRASYLPSQFISRSFE